MTEPRTAAGRALLAQAHLMHKRWPSTDGLIGRHDILAIEIEAYELGCAATARALAPTPPDALREAARAVVDHLANDKVNNLIVWHSTSIDALRAALEETP